MPWYGHLSAVQFVAADYLSTADPVLDIWQANATAAGPAFHFANTSYEVRTIYT
eukprot:SAG31_NODE_9516_length_1265_cov_1.874786_2_plen_53_part_01